MSERKYRVMQVIDSLKIGGAELMAVNSANALHEHGHDVKLCVTRTDGPLAERVHPEVEVIYLEKGRGLDLRAPYTLLRELRKHKSEIIHAHTGTYSVSAKAKVFTNAKLIWHDNYGKMQYLWKRPVGKLKLYAPLFDYTLVANHDLRPWAAETLRLPIDRISFMPNLVYPEPRVDKLEGPLPGAPGKRIICAATLRYPKDHINLLRAYRIVHEQHPDWSLLLAGKDHHDEYSQELKDYLAEHGFAEAVHFLGGRNDVRALMPACDLCVCASESEAGQLILLEYAFSRVATVSTDVGWASLVLEDGKIAPVVPPKDPESLAKAIIGMIEDEAERKACGERFYAHAMEHYAPPAFMKRLMSVYETLMAGK